MTSTISILEGFETTNSNKLNIKASKENIGDFAKMLEKQMNVKDEIKDVDKQSKGLIDETKWGKENIKEYAEDKWSIKGEDKSKQDISDEILALVNNLLELIDGLGFDLENNEYFEPLKLDMEFQIAKIEQLTRVDLVKYFTLEEINCLIEDVEAMLSQIKHPIEDNLEALDEYPALEEVEVTLNQIKETIENITLNKQQVNPTVRNNKMEWENSDEFELIQEPLEVQEQLLESIQSSEDEIISSDELLTENISVDDTQETAEETIEFNNSQNNPLLEVVNRTINAKTIETNRQELMGVNPKDIFKQIVEKAKFNIEDYKQEIRIKLKPEILGELMLKMEMEKGFILAKIMVDNYRTKEIIEANLYQLKEDMRENGLEIKTFEVFVGTNEDFEKEGRRNFNLNKKPNRFKIKDKELDGVETYIQNTAKIIVSMDDEGHLNLLA